MQNDWNDVDTAQEPAKGYTRQISHVAIVRLPTELKAAHDALLA